MAVNKNSLDADLTLRALSETGAVLTQAGVPGPVRLVIAGGMAGLLARLLKASRTTADCDVMWTSGGEDEWPRIEAAAASVAGKLGLPSRWLNRDCAMYAWCLPLGWMERCEVVGTFGALRVERLSRLDLLATKLMGSPKRPQDFEDLRAMEPTRDEVASLEKHLDRLTAEHLDGDTFDDQRVILEALRTG